MSNGLHFLNKESFPRKISKGDYFVKFFSPSDMDTHSKKLTEIWKQLAQKYEKSENVNIAEFDCSVAGLFCWFILQEYRSKGHQNFRVLTDTNW